MQLFYTHGDMVESLPPNAVSLGGTKEVPIQAAVYYDTESSVPDPSTKKQQDRRPIAITFQAHPEYASAKHLNGTLCPIASCMHERGDISDTEKDRVVADAKDNLAIVERHSIQIMATVGRLLGWFPDEQDDGR